MGYIGVIQGGYRDKWAIAWDYVCIGLSRNMKENGKVAATN